MGPEQAYAELLRRAREEALLASCGSLLEWDEDTYLPSRGVEHRSNQLAVLAGLQHQKATDPRLGELLAIVEASALMADPTAPLAANTRELRRVYERSTRLPRRLVEELTRITTVAQHAWVVARQEADFAHFRPWLEKIVSLKRAEAESLGYHEHPYDALLEEFEPGLRSRQVTALFDVLRRELVPLLEALTAAPAPADGALLHRAYAVDRQRAFGILVAEALGFDFERGRLDTAAHPFFTAVGPADCRITARYHPHFFSAGFFGILHEVGHGLYEQGLDPEQFGTPGGEAASLGLHEAQSRLWENLVGRSRAFWEHFFPVARRYFPEALVDVSVDDFYRAVNIVTPSWNRVEADEITYNLHILVRYQLEQALLTGALAVADVPTAWHDCYRQLLGIAPPNDAEGCLQDSHWAAGLWGYFPTYTLGNVFAAQLFAAAQERVGDLSAAFRRGEFHALLGWLRENIYRQGRRFSAAQLMQRVTGSPLDPAPLLAHLRGKYLRLYERCLPPTGDS